MTLTHSARILAAALAAILVSGVFHDATAQTACDRACLTKAMDGYLDSLVRRDAKSVPLAPNAEIRENTTRIALGQGQAWTKIAAIKARQDFSDPITGNIVSRDAVDLGNGKIGSLSVRLKLAKGKITQIESTLNQATGFFDAENMLEPDVIWDAIVPPSRRSSREDLMKIVDRYFDAIRDHGKGGNYETLFSKRCDRYESGRKMSNDPTNPSNESGALTCAGSLLNLSGQDVEQRRFPLIDTERGVVLAYGFIQHKERKTPQATGLAEMFKIVDGKLRQIENIEAVLPYPVEGGFTE